MPVDGTLITIIVLVLVAGGVYLLFRKNRVGVTTGEGDQGPKNEGEKRE
ncbi:MAG: hypothetical protein U1D96_10115 [Eubacteriales bacterium]|jgi:hypothetical protein|nr:hypothetical protein [Bacillota bacterium]MBV1727111.1 hypothetical protein [Desulforudis sp.]MDQ7789438.1 hypothetical protein [Clostridia bacterium]MDZ4043814.1 hypothetical protein [Eubacteriales bacterium]MBU4532318.1 hypothetical protein [Bacillota bacterium]